MLSHLVHVGSGAWVALVGGALVMLDGWAQLPGAQEGPAADITPMHPSVPMSQGPPGRV